MVPAQPFHTLPYKPFPLPLNTCLLPLPPITYSARTGIPGTPTFSPQQEWTHLSKSGHSQVGCAGLAYLEGREGCVANWGGTARRVRGGNTTRTHLSFSIPLKAQTGGPCRPSAKPFVHPSSGGEAPLLVPNPLFAPPPEGRLLS